MNLGTIIFDVNTDYAVLEEKLNMRISELLAGLNSCGCKNTPEELAVTQSTSYMYVANVDKLNGDTVRYQNCLQMAYGTLIKLELK